MRRGEEVLVRHRQDDLLLLDLGLPDLDGLDVLRKLRTVSGLPRYKPSSVLPGGTLEVRNCSLDGSASTIMAIFASLRRKRRGILAHARSTRQSNSWVVITSCYSTENSLWLS